MRSLRRRTGFSVIRNLRWSLPAMALIALLVAALDARDGDAGELSAQSESTVVEGIGGSAGPNPQLCARCYEQLQKDNRDCETLRGQDWQICREAASTAYRQCSEGC